MSNSSSRTSRIEARIAPESLLIVKRAAELQGRSLSDFIVNAAHEAAQRTIEEAHLIRLSVEDQNRFSDHLINPPEPSEPLIRAKEAHRRLIRESR